MIGWGRRKLSRVSSLSVAKNPGLYQKLLETKLLISFFLLSSLAWKQIQCHLANFNPKTRVHEVYTRDISQNSAYC